MPGGDGVVEHFADLADGGGADGFIEQGGECRAPLAGGDAGEEDLTQQLVDQPVATGVTLQHLGLEKTRTGARQAQGVEASGAGDEASGIKAVGLIGA